MSKKRWIALGIAIGLLFLSIFSQITATVATTDFKTMFRSFVTDYEERVVEEGSGFGKIAILHLEGIIQSSGAGGIVTTNTYNHKRFVDMLDQAADDPNVEGIILRVNTPGGGVVESAEIHEKVVEIQAENEKPVYVSMGNTAASGGYYIAAPAEKIIAHPATLTGSIGVIMESLNYAELAKKLGIDVNTIKSGEYKDIMSSSRPMTEEERAILQAMIDELYDEFVQVIVDGREMPEEKVRKLGDGRVYTGTQAQENGLVDELGTLDDTIALMKADHNLGDATVVEYSDGLGINQFISGSLQQFFDSKLDAASFEDLLRRANTPSAMYLYTK
ncbi:MULTISPECIES: signal peptide peptidase SppA [unclassified Virgibacillus]|uniref:signal peptide peptidase SppA n=1 Tax=unclassified Virgibacillus TaxID=2620237 RepID=UPI0024DE6DDE|nr:signal peptide peptidase SppA [Virgibacillus sp. LDC-1]